MKKALENMLMLPENTFLAGSFIQMDGNREILINGYGNILSYDSLKVKLTCRTLSLTVEGKGLYLNYMEKDAISIKGFIEALYFEKVI